MAAPEPRGPGRLAAALALVLGAVAVGAVAFGLWHVVVGGLVNGNPRAASFGVLLALVATAVLVAVVLTRRASLRGR